MSSKTIAMLECLLAVWSDVSGSTDMRHKGCSGQFLAFSLKQKLFFNFQYTFSILLRYFFVFLH